METATEYKQLFDRLTFIGLITLAALIISLLGWGIYYFNWYNGLVTVDSMDHAQVSRRLYLGRGFTTGFIKPASILTQKSDGDCPDLYNSPLPVFFLSRFYGIVGLNDFAVLGNSIFWAFLTGILLLILSRILFHNIILALMTFIAYMLNPGVLESAFSGLSISFISFVLVGFVFLIYFRNRSSYLWTAVMGVITGILCLSEFDYFFISLLIGIVIAYDSKGRRSFHLLVFAGALILSILPWLISNVIVAGDPFASLRWYDFKSYSILFSGNRIARDYNSNLLTLPVPIKIYWNKFLMFCRLMYSLWLSLSHSLLIPFFIGGVFLYYKNSRWKKVIGVTVLLFFGQLLMIGLGNGDFSRILCFMPLVIVGGFAALLQLISNLKLNSKPRSSDFMTIIKESPLRLNRDYKKTSNLLFPPGNHDTVRYSGKVKIRFPICKSSSWLIISLFFLFSIFPGLISVLYGLPDRQYISAAFSGEEARLMKEGETMEKIERIVKEHEVIVSDIPWAVAWYANRNAIWIPWEVEQMKEVKRKVTDLRFLHLSPLIFKYPDSENVAGWREIYQSGMVPEWLEADKGILLPGDHLIMGDIIFERLDLE